MIPQLISAPGSQLSCQLLASHFPSRALVQYLLLQQRFTRKSAEEANPQQRLHMLLTQAALAHASASQEHAFEVQIEPLHVREVAPERRKLEEEVAPEGSAFLTFCQS